MITTAPSRQNMEREDGPEWRLTAFASVILILDALVFGVAPLGPWDDASFSRGAIGLMGLALAYVSWYRYTFKKNGLIPWIDLWEDPVNSSRKVLVASVIALFLAWIVGNPMQHLLPDPTGLVISLVGLLLGIQGIYAMMTFGPLRED